VRTKIHYFYGMARGKLADLGEIPEFAKSLILTKNVIGGLFKNTGAYFLRFYNILNKHSPCPKNRGSVFW